MLQITTIGSCMPLLILFVILEGYEKLAAARRQGISADLGPGTSDNVIDNDFLANGENSERISSVFDLGKGAPGMNLSATTDNGDDAFDMFGEDDEKATVNPVSGRNDLDLSKSNEHPESKPKSKKFSFCVITLI